VYSSPNVADDSEHERARPPKLVAELIELRRANALLREKIAHQDVPLEEAARDR